MTPPGGRPHDGPALQEVIRDVTKQPDSRIREDETEEAMIISAVLLHHHLNRARVTAPMVECKQGDPLMGP